jgi:hypothetical protein
MFLLSAVAVASLLWVGMLLGVSFLEAWVKFRASSLTLPVGLDVGRHVFRALNLAELFWAVIGAAGLMACRWSSMAPILPFSAAFLTLVLQVLWLRPVLNRRVEAILAGGTLPRSPLHLLYIAGECVKLISLIIAGLLAILSAVR